MNEDQRSPKTPRSSQAPDQVPRGIEVLVSKASVDPAFKAILLKRRASAAEEIGLALEPPEVAMLNGVPEAQLEAIIARTKVPQEHRRAFLGKAAAVMLAAVGLTSPGCEPEMPAPTGSRPDLPLEEEATPEGDEAPGTDEAPAETTPTSEPVGDDQGQEAPAPEPVESDPEGISPQNPPESPPVIRGIRPDRIPTTKGIRPDLPGGND